MKASSRPPTAPRAGSPRAAAAAGTSVGAASSGANNTTAKLHLPSDLGSDDRLMWIRSVLDSGLMLDLDSNAITASNMNLSSQTSSSSVRVPTPPPARDMTSPRNSISNPRNSIRGKTRASGVSAGQMLPPQTFAKLFEDCLERDDRKNLRDLIAFLDDLNIPDLDYSDPTSQPQQQQDSLKGSQPQTQTSTQIQQRGSESETGTVGPAFKPHALMFWAEPVINRIEVAPASVQPGSNRSSVVSPPLSTETPSGDAEQKQAPGADGNNADQTTPCDKAQEQENPSPTSTETPAPPADSQPTEAAPTEPTPQTATEPNPESGDLATNNPPSETDENKLTGSDVAEIKQPAEPTFIIQETYRLHMNVQHHLPDNIMEAQTVLPKWLEVGYFSGHALIMLEQAISEVYLPLLSNAPELGGSGPSSSAQPPGGSGAGQDTSTSAPTPSAAPASVLSGNKSEFVVTLQKYATHIAHTAQQVAGETETRLKIPDDSTVMKYLMQATNANTAAAASGGRGNNYGMSLSSSASSGSGMGARGGSGSNGSLVLAVGNDPISEAAKDIYTVKVLEGLAEEWIETISNALAKELKKAPLGNGPLAEIEFWRDRYASLSTLYEQLNLPLVHTIVQILNMAQVQCATTFEFQLSELNKFYTEAQENVKFLSTLERHFKNIVTDSLTSVRASLPKLMEAIRMVWTISRHYNRDERMVPLMSRIAWELANKVSNIVDKTTILREPPAEAKKKIMESRELLKSWSETYFKVRERIEQSGRDQRWEFDRRKLFETTNYMAQRCEDLYEIAEVMEQFYNIFGAQLKAVTGDPQRIDEVIKRVDALVVPFEQFPYDIFAKKHQTAWEALMTRFREQIIQIEDMAKQFIDASFKKLRSAEGAFDLLQNIKTIKSREAINNQLMSKWYDILDQYAKEVDAIDDIFRANKANPPCTKNQPKVAGAISWSRSLFHRIKKTIIRFQSLQEMLASEQGRTVTKKYMTVAKSMKEYEEQLYAQWFQSVEANSLQHLKSFILLREVAPASSALGLGGVGAGRFGVSVPASAGSFSAQGINMPPGVAGGAAALGSAGQGAPNMMRTSSSTRPSMSGNMSATATAGIGVGVGTAGAGASGSPGLAVASNAMPVGGFVMEKIYVNFRPELRDIIKETKCLDKMGCMVPEAALNVALQEEKYYTYVESLNLMLHNYESVVEVLDSAERKLLQTHIGELKRVMNPGFTRLNWNSLGIQEFIVRCNQEINKLSSMVNQIRKNSANIAHAVDQIARAVFVREPPTTDIVDAHEFFDLIAKRRANVVETIVEKYRSIGPLLIKMESLVAGTNTGKSRMLKEYYAYWERRIFVALNQMVMNNLVQLERLLQVNQKKNKKFGKIQLKAPGTAFGQSSSSQSQQQQRLVPLFKVSAALSAPEIVITPLSGEIYKMMVKLTRSIVDATKQFHRWQNGTCIITPPQKVAEEEEPVVFSFHSDIVANQHIIQLIGQLNTVTTLEKFAQKRPSVVSYDDKLSFYSKLAKDVDSQPAFKDVDFIRVITTPLQIAIHSEADNWIVSIGKHLNTMALEDMNGLIAKMKKFEEDLQKTPDTLDDLTFVLNVIAEIKSVSEDVELKYRDVMEAYRTLDLYNIDVNIDEHATADSLPQLWQNMRTRAQEVDTALIPVKAKFTETTQNQVKDCKLEVKRFKEDFMVHGPGANADMDMDRGLELLKEAKETVANFLTRREHLVRAEKLFNLTVTSYPELFEVEAAIKELEKIFELYTEVKDSINVWSKTLWSNLDINVLTKGVDTFSSRLKKMPKELKQLPPYNVVAEKVMTFKDSIPLFADLKNDALRERHWKRLMEITGKTFDMNPETFTLEKLFSMNLHEHSESINEIVSGAMKELSIENGLKEIESTWRNTKFTVVKYMKGNEDRGYILGAVDEIILSLDDNAMSLQSIGASRFVAAFLPTVQQWEKVLSHIGEVIEVWMVVQRKWMYLESIFIGSGDIRMQLPDEATRFDRIDKSFKKLMNETAKHALVMEACNAEGRLQLLQGLSNDLEACQKSLSDYLESKRNAFPRFFFISDEELLSILGSHDPRNVQEHIIKMFDNVLKLNFGTGKHEKAIVGMSSSEGETLDFRRFVPVEGRVEEWMGAVEAEMKKTNRTIHKEAIFYYASMERLPWIRTYQGMVALAGSQVWWTWEVEDVFHRIKAGNKLAMKKYAKTLGDQLDELVIEVRSDLTPNDRKKINTQIVIDVHARDIVDRFVRDSIMDESEFEWESQLRFYWDRAADELLVRQCNGVFDYGYEYMGLNGRLVITPLTDRCYLTLTQALSMKLGGAPAGPAGTGKTETVKDLAKALGLLCIVTNCGEGMDYRAMGQIFSGLVQTGAWGCFDEFNRIELAVLSVISAQIKTIQNAVVMGLKRFQFEGNEIALDKKVGIFITMNPGYAGRTELPDNLKALFRPVVMVVPDLELICEIMLFSEGFTLAKALAKKMVVLYKLSKGQLSKQHHYDFGLRALKSVLVMAGSLKRGAPDLAEDVVLMRALRDMNLPKFVFEDVPLFLGLIGDLFPGLDCPRVRYPNFNDAVEDILRDNQYILVPEQVDKVVQLYETMMTRHTSMVVGPTGGGKSVVINTLAQAQTKLGIPTKLYVLNAKAVTVAELYGVLDPTTRDWTDGLLSNIFREVNKPTDKKERKYIVFDGDVDAVWVENMNSVMDDNKLLTLPNGERIRLQKHVSLLFEVGDLQYASPATVSRCGMVYMDPKNLGYKPFFQKWVNARPNKAEGDLLMRFFNK
ncbi:Dynein heavy chain 10, axonemal [Quaeritorhiza haematococci]|nr:Dynein heavy chain 10, axonemal [Quaeritorhiza haematococci]